jgi:hypothetical protein
MSDVQKPVEEPVVAPTTETPAAEPVEESKPVEETAAPAEAAAETATETPAVTEAAPATTEEAAAPVKEEAKPIEEGTLGYKGPGLIKYVLSLSYPASLLLNALASCMVTHEQARPDSCLPRAELFTHENYFSGAYLERGVYSRISFK